MSKFNTKKTGFGFGFIAGKLTDNAGQYSDYELLRRVTLANLLFESDYYQSADDIMKQIEDLCYKVDGEKIIQLAIECRFEQKLRHTPLWLLILAHEIHGISVKEAIAKIANRPDMTIDLLQMLKVRNGSYKMSKPIKKGLAKAFDQYDEYQISKYKKTNMALSLIDVVNMVHPKPTDKNEKALKDLVANTLQPANTWETALSQGAGKKETFERMISEKSLGALAILRNLRNMTEAGLSKENISTAISQVRSHWLTPLNFLAAQRNASEYTEDIDRAMKNCFAGEKIKGKTILAIDVSGSMGQVTSSHSKFSRMDLAFAMAAAGSYIFEDLILVFTAGNDGERKGKHMIWNQGKGLRLFDSYRKIYTELGGGGIFTHQLCEWLKNQGYAQDTERLVVISDSQDIDAYYGSDKKPDTSPYKTSYIIDISTHTHGIKTGNWTAEINGWSDKVFHYIKALES
ncbi:TROVE domain-containing protein [Chryseobacterium sp.]|uniref:TROVE domain-containing protein n=1 Tax=Chryseobacterium sp. TaxID=1871047 RepID=UPI0025C0B0FB|nr:TROVE domain-containing protein [Chryseobacterium sp.]MBV8325593.1 TROVE domain-containing protein [Chryseobacterium sp.]